ncbi:Lrp/AsnC family transcriptional regulator [Pseudonocardia sp. NPDC049635]|uniref:Lrp/AsnC family transcriptional regulator n=1 Tax=Pseudonocardia sp. NPDC049635 TaxID=3155506 RepID=UPI0033C22894
MQELDEIDHSLLRLLHEDGRRTFADMAITVGLSTAAVKRRVDRMRESGVITGFTVQVDHKKLGWAVEAFSEIRYAGTASISDIVESAARQPEVQAVYTLAGDLDALVQVRVRDLTHLQEVIDRIRRSGTVTGTRTLMVLGRWTRG